jgi:hypothetical protein
MNNKTLILILCLFSFSLFAQVSVVSSGNPIEASKMNELIQKINQVELNQKNQIGVIQQALLTESQFQSLNGSCWVAMSGQSIAGSDYAILTGLTTLPNAQGRFLRNSGGDAAPLATLQDDELKSHTHVAGAVYNTHSGAGVRIGTAQGTNLGNLTTGATGGAETRPKNLTVNYFIKINKLCN